MLPVSLNLCPKTYITLPLPYFTGQRSHKPSQIQREETHTTLLNRKNVKEFINISNVPQSVSESRYQDTRLLHCDTVVQYER